jgi:hypothetical protein
LSGSLPVNLDEAIMFEQVRSLEEDLYSRSPGDERRASVRRRMDGVVVCRLLGGNDKPLEARVRDASPLGVGLRLSQPVELGALLRLDFEDVNQYPQRTVLARVVHVTALAEGWGVGCAFIRELEAKTLRLFQAERTLAPAEDTRRWQRFPCNVEAVCSSLDTTAGEQSPARIVDVSAGGVGLLLPCEFGPGTLLRLLLPATAGQTEPLLLRVARAAARPRRDWFLGCEFAERLDERELAALLGDYD